MRLTLRTLLAYLDDILDPADAREIGVKISESPVAGKMVERIREVMRRRRITAPELTGPGSGPDPNLVAEYLDNTLPPEAVTEIERICLESDIHLAEAAGCHQILTIVLGEPVDIVPGSRERMYALGAIAPPPGQDGSVSLREPVPSAMADTRRTAAEAAANVQAGDETFSGGVPDYLRRRPLWRRLLPAAVVVVLAAWLTYLLSDSSLWGPLRPVATVDSAADPNSPEIAEGPPADALAAPPANAIVEKPAADVVIAATAPPERSPPAVVPEVSIPPVPEVDIVETPDTDVVERPAEVTVVEPAPVAVVDHSPPMTYSSLDGIALKYQADINDWNVLPRHTAVKAGDWIATPEPFTSRIDVNGGQLRITVNSGSIVQLLASPEGHMATLLIDSGRVGLYRPAGDGAAPDPLSVSVRVGEIDFDIDLLEPGTLVGIDAAIRPPTGQPESPAPLAYDGGIYLVAGSAAIHHGADQPVAMSIDSGWLPWPAADGVWQPGALLSTPQWLTPDGRTLASSDQTFAQLYERMFTINEPVSVNVPGIVRDRRSRIARYAVETLALTQNIPELMRALQTEHDEARRAAIVGLREWLPRSPDNADILHDEITRYFRDVEVAPVEELLWGYSLRDLRDADVSERLLGWLAHENLAIRELAIFQIRTGTNRPSDYHPLATVAQRQAAIARLNEIVRRQGALLPPAPPAPASE